MIKVLLLSYVLVAKHPFSKDKNHTSMLLFGIGYVNLNVTNAKRQHTCMFFKYKEKIAITSVFILKLCKLCKFYCETPKNVYFKFAICKDFSIQTSFSLCTFIYLTQCFIHTIKYGTVLFSTSFQWINLFYGKHGKQILF